MAATFEVSVSELHTGATNLAGDSAALTAAATSAGGAIDQAAAAVPGGRLVAALGALGDEVATRCAQMGTAITGAGTTLSANAARYAGDDAAAAGALNAAMTFGAQVAL